MNETETKIAGTITEAVNAIREDGTAIRKIFRERAATIDRLLKLVNTIPDGAEVIVPQWVGEFLHGELAEEAEALQKIIAENCGAIKIEGTARIRTGDVDAITGAPAAAEDTAGAADTRTVAL